MKKSKPAFKQYRFYYSDHYDLLVMVDCQEWGKYLKLICQQKSKDVKQFDDFNPEDYVNNVIIQYNSNLGYFKHSSQVFKLINTNHKKFSEIFTSTRIYDKTIAESIALCSDVYNELKETFLKKKTYSIFTKENCCSSHLITF